MTQAPTPGPLSVGQEETIAFNLCAVHGFDPGFVKTQRDFALAVIREYEVVCRPRLAPTAPVEASGSEQRYDSIREAEDRELFSPDLRPQPSGETREEVARVLEPWGPPQPGRGPVTVRRWEDALSKADAILAVLYARPLALGGQQGEALTFGAGKLVVDTGRYHGVPAVFICAAKVGGSVGSSAAVENNPTDCLQPNETVLTFPTMEQAKAVADALTTPARAEAQDEGAATDALVDRFAVALKAKLRAAGEKYGFDDAWRADDWRDKLIEDLWRHVQKGDPRDVAAYCAFAWHHQWSLSNGVFPRAGKNLITPQDEGAAGEPVAKVVRKGFSTGSISWTKFGQDADLSDETPLYAHPSPTPSQDEGAAGYKAALIDDLRRYYNDCTPPQMHYAQSDGLAFALDTAIRLLSESHPSPTPAADADRVRIAVEALEPFAHIASHVGLPKADTVHVTALDGQWIATVQREDFWKAHQALAALKSTAAKEGGEV